MSFDPLNRQEPFPFAMSNGSEHRNPDTYISVIKQFDVENNIRYKSISGETWCNVYLWDVSRAFAAEIPHWVVGHENNANAMILWLQTEGPNYGWQSCDQHTAQANASQGMPTVVMYKNPIGLHGHCAWMLPDGSIAQAGLNCFFGKPISSGFGNLPVLFFVHA